MSNNRILNATLIKVFKCIFTFALYVMILLIENNSIPTIPQYIYTYVYVGKVYVYKMFIISIQVIILLIIINIIIIIVVVFAIIVVESCLCSPILQALQPPAIK